MVDETNEIKRNLPCTQITTQSGEIQIYRNMGDSDGENREEVKYHGHGGPWLHRLVGSSKTELANSCEFNPLRPSCRGHRDRSVGINTRTLRVSVEAGPFTGPDDTRLTTPIVWVSRGTTFPYRTDAASWGLQDALCRSLSSVGSGMWWTMISLRNSPTVQVSRGTLAVLPIEKQCLKEALEMVEV